MNRLNWQKWIEESDSKNYMDAIVQFEQHLLRHHLKTDVELVLYRDDSRGKRTEQKKLIKYSKISSSCQQHGAAFSAIIKPGRSSSLGLNLNPSRILERFLDTKEEQLRLEYLQIGLMGTREKIKRDRKHLESLLEESKDKFKNLSFMQIQSSSNSKLAFETELFETERAFWMIDQLERFSAITETAYESADLALHGSGYHKAIAAKPDIDNANDMILTSYIKYAEALNRGDENATQLSSRNNPAGNTQLSSRYINAAGNTLPDRIQLANILRDISKEHRLHLQASDRQDSTQLNNANEREFYNDLKKVIAYNITNLFTT